MPKLEVQALGLKDFAQCLANSTFFLFLSPWFSKDALLPNSVLSHYLEVVFEQGTCLTKWIGMAHITVRS